MPIYRQPSVVVTSDGSKTFYSHRFGEHYHSKFGATSESRHVFVGAGYLSTTVSPVTVLEIGFGTGLNAWLTMQEADKMHRPTYYETIERYPVEVRTILKFSDDKVFLNLHLALWERAEEITPDFVIQKRLINLQNAVFSNRYDVVYFDAFSPTVQPELWTVDIFSRIFEAMNPGAILTTYCAKGTVRRMMQKCGFLVEQLPGPAGKREILRAKKPEL